MKNYRQEHYGWIEKWQQYERTAYPLILGLLGTIFTIYLQKIEWILLESQWRVASAYTGSGIVLFTYWLSKQLFAFQPIKIKGIRFWVHEDAPSALTLCFAELAHREEDVSREDILEAIPEEYRMYVFMPFQWFSLFGRRPSRR
jgi:hypothetical protein